MKARSLFGDVRRLIFGAVTRMLLLATSTFTRPGSLRIYIQTRLIDIGFAHHGLVKSMAIPFNRGVLQTPWLPLLRVQLRAHFVDREYDFNTQTGGVYVDLGANQGIFSIWVWLTRSPAYIIAVEADPAVHNSFTEPNMSSYIPNNSYVAFNVAVGANSGEAEFYSTGLDDGSLDPNTLVNHKKSDVTLIRVPVMTLDEIIKDYPKIELLKIDIEGAEWEVLESTTRLGDIRTIHVESALRNYNWDVILRAITLLQSHSFSVAVRIETLSKMPNQILSSKDQEIWGFLYLTADQKNMS